MTEFKKVLASVEAAYTKVQEGALGRTVLKSEGASSYSVTVRDRARAKSRDSTIPPSSTVPPSSTATPSSSGKTG